jgi:hypothetical protein
MKMRLRSNSVRFRLTKTEVATMQDLGECSESILFPNGTCLAYSLLASECPAVQAEFEKGTVKIRVPRQDILAWSTTETPGIYATVEDKGVALRISVEKDFRCLDSGSDEDQSDMFSNPADGKLTC